MDEIELIDDWENQKRRLKQKIAHLTNNEKLILDEKKEEILSLLKEKFGKTKEELLNIIT